MTDRTALDNNKPSLGDLVHCANCGAAMAHTSQLYYCPNASLNSGRNCPTNPVGTRLLLYKVFSGLIHRFITDDVISHATRVIRATTEPRANALRQQLDSAEAILADAKTQDPTAFRIAETAPSTTRTLQPKSARWTNSRRRESASPWRPGKNSTSSPSSPTNRASETTPPTRRLSWKETDPTRPRKCWISWSKKSWSTQRPRSSYTRWKCSRIHPGKPSKRTGWNSTQCGCHDRGWPYRQAKIWSNSQSGSCSFSFVGTNPDAFTGLPPAAPSFL